MGFFKKIKEVFPKDLMALFRTDKDEEENILINYSREVPDVLLKGGWEEGGKNKWGTFRPRKKEENIISKKEKKDTLSEPDKLKKTEKSTTEEKKIKVFFAEDNRAFQNILKTIINKSEDMELLDWAKDGLEAVDKIRSMSVYPDIILMDIAMPRIKGIEAAKKILEINPSQKIVMLTAFGDKENVINAFAAGALGFLRKDAGVPMIKEAIQEVARGGVSPMQDEVARFFLEVTE